MAQQVTNYKCPACTGPLHYAAGTDKLECEYCGSIYEIAEVEAMYASADGKAEAAMAAAQAKAEAGDEWEVSEDQWNPDGMKTYNCPSCGAELVCEETMAASNCPYCGNPTIVPGQFSGMLKPEYIIPFKHTKENAVEALKKHYGKRFLLPKEFKDENHLEEVKGVYVPFWLYDGRTEGSGVYEGIKEHTRTMGDERITTTEYYNVRRCGGLAFEKIPADASSHMDDALMESVEPYNYDEIKPFSKAYITGYMADKYDETAEENAERAVKRAKASTASALRNDVRGYSRVNTRSENIRVEQGKVSYALLPVWLLTTKWNGNNYTFAMNGQTGKMVGNLPVNKGKLWLTTILVFLAITAASFFMMGEDLVVPVIIGAIVAGITALILNASMKSVAAAYSADDYVDRNSVEITFRRDLYVRTEERRERIQRPENK